MQIPVAEIPGLEGLLERMEEAELRITRMGDDFIALKRQLEDTRKAHGTVLSGLLPGGMMHDRIAETRAAVKALADSPESPHHAATQSLMRLNWGQMSVEE